MEFLLIVLIVAALYCMIAMLYSLVQWKKKLGADWYNISNSEKIRCITMVFFLSPRMATDKKLRKHYQELYDRLNTETKGFYEIYGKNFSYAAILVLSLFFMFSLFKMLGINF